MSLRKWLIPVKPDELSGILYYNVCKKKSRGGGDVARALVPLGPPCKHTVVLMILILEFPSHKSGHILHGTSMMFIGCYVLKMLKGTLFRD